MKKINLAGLLMLIVSVLQLNGQTLKEIERFYVTYEQSFLFLSNDIPLIKSAKYTPTILLGVQLNFSEKMSGFAELGFGIEGSRGMINDINHFGELDKDNNMNNLSHWHNDDDQAYIKLNAGVARHLRFKKWTLSPQVGFGIWTFASDQAYYELKEEGSSNMYNVYYKAGRSSDQGEVMPYFLFRLKAEKKLGRLSFALGAGYNLFLSKFSYSGKLTDHYTGETIQSFEIKKLPHELSLSLSVGFR